MKKVYDPNKLTSVLQHHHGLLPRIKLNRGLHYQSVRYLLAQHIFNKHKAMHVYNTMVKKETIDSIIYVNKVKTWKQSLRSELGVCTKAKKWCERHRQY